jgi:2-polyprenyl-6-methoxyphenol hydroxylase-like FAD-dependent oxidoreductase
MQHARELLDRIGLLQELEAVGAVLRQNMAIATGQHDRQVKVTAADFPGKVDAGHARHHHVSEDHVEPK